MQTLFENEKFKWIDLHNPTKEELNEMASTYSFQKLTIEDSLEAGHLPKYESDDATLSFLLIRFFDQEHRLLNNTVREFSHKISIYFGANFIVTVHQKETEILEIVKNKCLANLNPENVLIKGIVYRIISETIKTYEAPAFKMDEDISALEQLIFTNEFRKIKIPTLYKIKREATACKKILNFTYDTLKEFRADNKKTTYTQDLLEETTKMLHLHSQIADDVQNLLTTFLSLNGQRSNEIMQTLTVFSAFFLPLTFIAGIYGMNFDYMPELNYKFGYPICLLIMLIVVIFIYFWFRKKRYL